MATFASDTFTGTNGTALQSHTSDSGHSWTAGVGSSGNATIDTNRLVDAGFNGPWYYSSAVPASADYSVSCDLQIDAASNYVGGPMGRVSTSANTGYAVYWNGGAQEWRLNRSVAGTDTEIGLYAGDAPTTTRTVKLQMTGTTIEVLIGGVSRISVTDSGIAAAGRPGIYVIGGANTRWADNWVADQAASGASITGTGALTITKPTTSGSAVEGKVASSASLTKGANQVSGAGIKGITGSGGVTIRVPTILSITGSNQTGSGVLTAAAITSAGTAYRGTTDVPGPIDIVTNSVASVSGTAVVGVARTASGALTSSRATAAGVASHGKPGTGALVSRVPTVSGTSAIGRALTATGALTSPGSTVSGATTFGHAGTGALTMSRGFLNGVGVGVLSNSDYPYMAHPYSTKRPVKPAHGAPHRRG